MEINKGLLVSIVIAIHMALTGLALIKLFKLKNATGGLVIISLIVLMIPVLGPSGLIMYYNKLIKQEELRKKLKTNFNQRKSTKKNKVKE